MLVLLYLAWLWFMYICVVLYVKSSKFESGAMLEIPREYFHLRKCERSAV